MGHHRTQQETNENRQEAIGRIGHALFDRQMQPAQADGCAFLLAAAGTAGLTRNDTAALAYGLATAWHETGGLLQPVRERGGAAYLRRRYDVTGDDPARARAHGNLQPGDGPRYAGRGYVQLTWKANYARVGALLGIDLVAAPDRALEPALAATILFRGMAEGWFTGRRLSEFIGPEKTDFVQARRVVNGLDRAALIAGRAEAILAALRPLPVAGAVRPRPGARPRQRPPLHP